MSWLAVLLQKLVTPMKRNDSNKGDIEGERSSAGAVGSVGAVGAVGADRIDASIGRIESNPLASYLALDEKEMERSSKSLDRVQLQGGTSGLWVVSKWVAELVRFQSASFFFLTSLARVFLLCSFHWWNENARKISRKTTNEKLKKTKEKSGGRSEPKK